MDGGMNGWVLWLFPAIIMRTLCSTSHCCSSGTETDHRCVQGNDSHLKTHLSQSYLNCTVTVSKDLGDESESSGWMRKWKAGVALNTFYTYRCFLFVASMLWAAVCSIRATYTLVKYIIVLLKPTEQHIMLCYLRQGWKVLIAVV